MWSFCVEYLDDTGAVLKTSVVSASNPRHAEIMASRNAPADYSEVQVTRL